MTLTKRYLVPTTGTYRRLKSVSVKSGGTKVLCVCIFSRVGQKKLKPQSGVGGACVAAREEKTELMRRRDELAKATITLLRLSSRSNINSATSKCGGFCFP